MRTTFVFALALCAIGCAGGQRHTKMPSAEEAQSLDAFVREQFDHMSRGDFAYMKSSACPEAIVYDTDENGAPVAARGKTEIDALLDRYTKMMQSGGVSMSTNLTRVDCRSLGGSGVCAVEFDQSMTAHGQAMGPFKLRATMVMERHKDRWIWVHWHASARELPQAQASAAAQPAPAAPAPAAQPVPAAMPSAAPLAPAPAAGAPAPAAPAAH